MARRLDIWVADFETTTDTGEVWSAAFSQVGKKAEYVSILGSIDEFMNTFLRKTWANNLVYFHNLKFDGNFIINWLLDNGYEFTENYQLGDNQFSCIVSTMGSYYAIKVKKGWANITFMDSLKIMPFSLKKAGKSFNTKHQKLEMEYDNKRSLKDCTREDIEYIKNDVHVLRECIEYLQSKNITKMTIGSCCVQEFKDVHPDYIDELCRMDKIDLDESEYGAKTADEYCRKGYRGGWCICFRPGYYDTLGCTYDVNSLYPSVMTGESGNFYPVGSPHFWKGEIPEAASIDHRVFFIRFKCTFKLREGYLPTLQIKRSVYRGSDYLTTSDYEYKGKKYKYMKDENGVPQLWRPEITLTSVDWEIFKEHYEIDNLEILDGCWFYTKVGIFNSYIRKWEAIKIKASEEHNEGLRTLAKLFLNNLYGKLASSTDSSYKVPYKENGVLKWKTVTENKKKPMHIGMGAFVTAYARKFTITAAQANYDRFVYADTDSIHLLGTDDAKGVKEHPSEFLCWKREHDWDEATFVRQKTYAEHNIKADRQEITPYWDIKGCGCPDRCKNLFLEAVDGKERVKNKTEKESAWVLCHKGITLRDYKEGLEIEGKLMPKQTKHGVILEATTFTINKRVY